jgi:hypothetical protein
MAACTRQLCSAARRDVWGCDERNVANPIARRGNVVRLKAIAGRGCTLGVEELVTVGQTGP